LDIDTRGLSIPTSLLIAAFYSFYWFLRLVTPFVRDRCFCEYRYRRCGVATGSLRYFHLGRCFLSRRTLPWLMV